ncbi:MAG: cobalamin-dependent protein [Candidatus Aenigmatarchaeota archaeon]
MLSKDILKRITDGIVNLEYENVKKLINSALEKDIKPLEILEALRKGLEKVGEKFEKQEYFLSELIMAGEIMKDLLNTLKPYLFSGITKVKGKIVLGTILGDLHDIGKDIIKTLLISSGFEVYDLGIDVPPEQFVKKAEEVHADIIGISALLSTTVPITAEVVKYLEEANLRKKVKVIIGGAAVRKEHIKKYGVDAAVNDAIEGLNIIKTWMGIK